MVGRLKVSISFAFKSVMYFYLESCRSREENCVPVVFVASPRSNFQFFLGKDFYCMPLWSLSFDVMI